LRGRKDKRGAGQTHRARFEADVPRRVEVEADIRWAIDGGRQFRRAASATHVTGTRRRDDSCLNVEDAIDTDRDDFRVISGPLSQGSGERATMTRADVLAPTDLAVLVPRCRGEDSSDVDAMGLPRSSNPSSGRVRPARWQADRLQKRQPVARPLAKSGFGNATVTRARIERAGGELQ
jgi:hypothetical protein